MHSSKHHSIFDFDQTVTNIHTFTDRHFNAPFKLNTTSYEIGKIDAESNIKANIHHLLQHNSLNISAIATFHNNPAYVAGNIAQLLQRELQYVETIKSPDEPVVAVDLYNIDGVDTPFLISYLPHQGKNFKEATKALGNKNKQIELIRQIWLDKKMVTNTTFFEFYDDSLPNFNGARKLNYIQGHLIAPKITEFTVIDKYDARIVDSEQTADAETPEPVAETIVESEQTNASHIQKPELVVESEQTNASGIQNSAPVVESEQTNASGIQNSEPVVESEQTNASGIQNSAPVVESEPVHAKETLDPKQIAVFEEHLKTIKEKALKLKTNGHEAAAEAAKKLDTYLSTQYAALVRGEVTLPHFKGDSQKAITEAHIVLDKHRGWMELLGNLATLIVGLFVGFLVKGIYNRLNDKPFLFFAKTYSHTMLDETEKSIVSLTI